MRLPHDIFPTTYEYDMYLSSYRVRVFLADTESLTKEMVVGCLLKQIDLANEELGRMRAAEVMD